MDEAVRALALVSGRSVEIRGSVSGGETTRENWAFDRCRRARYREASPRLYATTDCADFGIVADEGLEIFAEPASFRIAREAGPAAFEIRVPSEGDYIWETFVGRSTNHIVSKSLGEEAFSPSGSGAIVLRKLTLAHRAACSSAALRSVLATERFAVGARCSAHWLSVILGGCAIFSLVRGGAARHYEGRWVDGRSYFFLGSPPVRS